MNPLTATWIETCGSDADLILEMINHINQLEYDVQKLKEAGEVSNTSPAQ